RRRRCPPPRRPSWRCRLRRRPTHTSSKPGDRGSAGARSRRPTSRPSRRSRTLRSPRRVPRRVRPSRTADRRTASRLPRRYRCRPTTASPVRSALARAWLLLSTRQTDAHYRWRPAARSRQPTGRTGSERPPTRAGGAGSARSPQAHATGHAVVSPTDEEGPMAENQYDASVVGARCAGSPTAMLLARKGYNVLVVDRATFPSDTMSTHIVHPPGVAALREWGLLGRPTATGCPPIDTYAFDFGPFSIFGGPGTADSPISYCPRRTVLDKLLVDGASEAGAEVREGFTVEDVVVEEGRVTGVRGHAKGGKTVTEQANVFIGADGRSSLVARTVRPEQYNEKPQILCGYYSYWSGLPMDGRFEVFIRPDRGWGVAPTHDDLRSSSQVGRSRSSMRTRGTSKATISGCSIWRRSSPTESAAPSARPGSSARPCPTTSGGPSGPAGRWSATPATTRTSSLPRGSATPSATPSCARRRSTRRSPALATSTWRWARTSPRVTSTSCRSSSSPASSRRSSRHRPRCSSCWRQCTATRR